MVAEQTIRKLMIKHAVKKFTINRTLVVKFSI